MREASKKKLTEEALFFTWWEKLVEAVLKREELRQIAFSESFSTSISPEDFSSRFSFDSVLEDVPAGFIQSNFSYRDVQPIEFKEIKKATKNFRPGRFIAETGFCEVYKGWIDASTLTASNTGSGLAIAVKMWKNNGLQGHQEWPKKIDYLSQLRHPNLVKLIGHCSEEGNMILVYEFMAKGSLDNYLFGSRHLSLPWVMRIKVAIGVARGLSYLHDKELPVIYQDFKTANILLDGEFNAKLSNFSLARDGPTGDMTHVSTQVVVGAYGYAAPEYVASGRLTPKCNVFEFGVVLLELLFGRRAYDRNRATEEQNLVEWAKPYLGNKRKLLQIMDTRLDGQYPHKGAYKVAKLALQCISSDPKLRPRMAEVVVALEQL